MRRSRSSSYTLLGMTALFGIAVAGCEGSLASPTAPSASIGTMLPSRAAFSLGGHAVPLTEVAGSVPGGGAGMLNDNPNP